MKVAKVAIGDGAFPTHGVPHGRNKLDVDNAPKRELVKVVPTTTLEWHLNIMQCPNVNQKNILEREREIVFGVNERRLLILDNTHKLKHKPKVRL